MIGGIGTMAKDEEMENMDYDNGSEEEMPIDDVVRENNVVLNTLIDYLIEKKIISEKEFLAKLNATEEELDEDTD
jgi:hypothetical protein